MFTSQLNGSSPSEDAITRPSLAILQKLNDQIYGMMEDEMQVIFISQLEFQVNYCELFYLYGLNFYKKKSICFGLPCATDIFLYVRIFNLVFAIGMHMRICPLIKKL